MYVFGSLNTWYYFLTTLTPYAPYMWTEWMSKSGRIMQVTVPPPLLPPIVNALRRGLIR